MTGVDQVGFFLTIQNGLAMISNKNSPGPPPHPNWVEAAVAPDKLWQDLLSGPGYCLHFGH